MNTSELCRFESFVLNDTPLRQLWNDFSPSLNATVENVENARSIYSNALKITCYVAKEEKIKAVWLDVLRQGSFILSLNEKEPRKYNFSAIIELAESGKKEFETELVKVDPKKNDLLAVAKAISIISLESVGQSAEIDFYRQILTSKDTFCLVAKEKESLIACSYGTHVNVDGIELFHLNFLGRRIEYPSLHMVENLRKQLSVLQEHYPFLHYLTLCVAVENTHMISIYEKEGFQQCAYLEKGTMGFPIFFYCKKIAPNLDIPLPSYEKFQNAMKIKREEQKMEFLESLQ